MSKVSKVSCCWVLSVCTCNSWMYVAPALSAVYSQFSWSVVFEIILQYDAYLFPLQITSGMQTVWPYTSATFDEALFFSWQFVYSPFAIIGTICPSICSISYRWRSAKLQYLPCVCNGDAGVLCLTIDMKYVHGFGVGMIQAGRVILLYFVSLV